MTNLNFKIEYPIVIKRVGIYLTISVPDLGISKKVLLQSNAYTCESDQFLNELKCTISEAQKHIEQKSWQPKSSSIRDVLHAPAGDLTLPKFCKQLKEKMKISENTIRREIERGTIISNFTSGGHRRIPESEINRYLNSCVPFRDENSK